MVADLDRRSRLVCGRGCVDLRINWHPRLPTLVLVCSASVFFVDAAVYFRLFTLGKPAWRIGTFETGPRIVGHFGDLCGGDCRSASRPFPASTDTLTDRTRLLFQDR
jgi:hypothetical protein